MANSSNYIDIFNSGERFGFLELIAQDEYATESARKELKENPDTYLIRVSGQGYLNEGHAAHQQFILVNRESLKELADWINNELAKPAKPVGPPEDVTTVIYTGKSGVVRKASRTKAGSDFWDVGFGVFTWEEIIGVSRPGSVFAISSTEPLY